MRYYLDTCIWRDYAENRSDRFRPLGEWALKLIQRINEEDDVVLVSYELIRELRQCFDAGRIDEILAVVGRKEVVVSTTKQRREAHKIGRERKIGFSDAMHAIFARDHQAQLVTRDRHFQLIRDITLAKLPEELL